MFILPAISDSDEVVELGNLSFMFTLPAISDSDKVVELGNLSFMFTLPAISDSDKVVELAIIVFIFTLPATYDYLTCCLGFRRSRGASELVNECLLHCHGNIPGIRVT